MRYLGFTQLVVWMVAATAFSLMNAPVAAAAVGLYPGMPIVSSIGTCSLGFLATNTKQQRLAVTAGHCAKDIDDVFTTTSGAKIGRVVSHWSDAGDSDAYFGFTLIWLYDTTYTSNAYFTGYRSPDDGEWIWKYGEHTKDSKGKITSVYYKYADTRPETSAIYSNVIVLPGDSGSPWYTTDKNGNPILVGISIGNRTKDDGTYVGAYGFPIYSMLRFIEKKAESWGAGINVVGK